MIDPDLAEQLRGFAIERPADAARVQEALEYTLQGAPLRTLRLAILDSYLINVLAVGGPVQLRTTRDAVAEFLTRVGALAAAERCQDQRWLDAEMAVERDPDALQEVATALALDDPLLPPQLPDFAFGEHSGPVEDAALFLIVDALSQAWSEGRLDTSRPDWRQVRLTLAQDILDGPPPPAVRAHPDDVTTAGAAAGPPASGGAPLRRVIEAERVGIWRRSRGALRQDLADRVAPLIVDPVRWHPGLSAATERITSLLDLYARGAPVHDSVDPTVAKELAARFGWATRGRSVPAEELYQLAARAGLLTVVDDRIVPSEAARRLRSRPDALWAHVCQLGLPVAASPGEVLLMLLVTQQEWSRTQLVAAAQPVVEEEQYLWRALPSGEVVPNRGMRVVDELHTIVDSLIATLTALGALETTGHKLWGHRLRVVPPHDRTVRAILRGSAAGPLHPQ